MEKMMVEMPTVKFKMMTAKIAVRAKLPPAVHAPVANNTRMLNAVWVIDVPLGRDSRPCRATLRSRGNSMIHSAPVSRPDHRTTGETTSHLRVR